MIDHPRYQATEVLGKGAQGLVVRVIDRERPHAKLVAKVNLAQALVIERRHDEASAMLEGLKDASPAEE